MSNRLIKSTWNIGNITFHMCGLDKEKNFLESPKCECEYDYNSMEEFWECNGI